MPKGYKTIRLVGEKQWLDQHGGRNKGDIRKDKNGFFVLMSDGWGSDEKVYLPLFSNND